MKPGPNSRRLRNRGNGKRHLPGRGQTFESSGPDCKIRGTAQQVLERYLVLARDASSAGDPITAESYFQHAEHYYRVLNNEAFSDRGADRQRRPQFGPAASPENGTQMTDPGSQPQPALTEDAEPSSF